MVRRWISDIKVKTAEMSREQAVEYVFTYYWYHILLTAIALGLVILVIYHIGWGDKSKDFTCVLVNQRIDYDRDERIAEEFSKASGISKKKLAVDSDYLISYDDVKIADANESSYEKFFFNWMAGEVDAVVMPESFYRYCKEQGGSYTCIDEMLEEELPDDENLFYEDGGEKVGIYVERTKLETAVIAEVQDPLVLVFPAESKHKKAGEKFAQFVLDL
ncbi:hypothetical protein ABXS75_02490 [Roseburia hominis]